MYSKPSDRAALGLNALFQAVAIPPDQVVVLRHRPKEAAFRRVLPWLSADRLDLFDLYQSLQGEQATRMIRRAGYVASFIGQTPGTATFAGLFKVGAASPISPAQFSALPGAADLAAYRLEDFARDGDWRIELEPLDIWRDWVGRLVVDWSPPERSWIRRAERNHLAVRAIALESEFAKAMPAWDDLVLSWSDLAVLPPRWRHALAEWRGIYFIFDTARRMGYVGSAYGDENLLGRWENYRRTGDGGNLRLRESQPQDLRFSILQLMAPSEPMPQVQAAEAAWKRRLHTREFGLNAN